jgi:hypothetical protein
MAAVPTQLFINNPLVLNQDTNVYGSFINEGTYDYTFVINVANFASNITTMFANASYIQNSVNIDNYDVNITLNSDANFLNWNAVFNNQPIVSINMGNSNIAFPTLEPTAHQTIGDRLLEVVAHKLFGHGQAHAAISNDSEYYTHDATVWNHLVNSVSMNNFRNDIFNQYVATDRYEHHAVQNNGTDGNDVDNWTNFNFNGMTFDYPLFLTGNMITDPSLTNVELDLITNGPNIGGTLLVNGEYNIPILIRFTQ